MSTDHPQTTSCTCVASSTYGTDDPAVRRCDLCDGIVPTDPATGEYVLSQTTLPQTCPACGASRLTGCLIVGEQHPPRPNCMFPRDVADRSQPTDQNWRDDPSRRERVCKECKVWVYYDNGDCGFHCSCDAGWELVEIAAEYPHPAHISA